MDINSRLDGNSICADCDKMVMALEQEITNYKSKIQALEKFGNLDISGESVTALKARNNDLIGIINKMIEADTLDIRDYKIMQEHVRNVYIIGEEVIENLRKTRFWADACYDTAESLWNAAENAFLPIEADALRNLSNASRKAGDGWERIYAYWKGQEELFDSIDCSTSNLFSEGFDMQTEAHTLMMSFSQSKISFNPVKLIRKNKSISRRYISTLEMQIKYLSEQGFEDEEIDFLYNEYPGLISSLFATLNFSSPDAEKILKQMRIECLKDNYVFLYNDLISKFDMKNNEAGEQLYKLYVSDELEIIRDMYAKSENDYNQVINGFDSYGKNFADYIDGKLYGNTIVNSSYFTEEDIDTYDEMFSLQTPEILARCIYQECHVPEGQTDVMWSIINRYYSDKNFTKGKENIIYNILKYGGYESINQNDDNVYNAYHPDYDSDGWKNAMIIAENVYDLIGDSNASDTSENHVRDALEDSVNIFGNRLVNNIGESDSFWGDGKENHFYEM